ncbi:hypothetical protein [Pinibacter soli]|uniref:DUF4239 domain-containing protein n=1 Tax=Pinibacter soli TaxID=3044211 RepID=A0ABT6RBE0_9BACT|nr:hypothetical protein [Pinibacter soli]MDI3319731.1 hypothetical protein [Pinibacter soli]
MNQFNEKLRLIYLPFIATAVGFVLFYTFLNWALFVKGNFFSLKQDILNLWLPFGLSVIPVLIWVRPKIKLLRFKNDRASTGYSMVAWFAIIAPAIITQHYLETATGKLTALNNISQFNTATATKYYSLEKCYIDKAHASIHTTANVSGKHDETLSYCVFVTIPLYENASDTISKKCNFWLGENYKKSISNRLSSEEKREKYVAFAQEAQQKFDTTKFENFVYLERLLNTDDHEAFNAAVAKNKFFSSDQPVVFVAHQTAFKKRNGETLPWIFKSFGIGALVFLILLLFPSLDSDKLASIHKIKRAKRSERWLGLLVDTNSKHLNQS